MSRPVCSWWWTENLNSSAVRNCNLRLFLLNAPLMERMWICKYVSVLSVRKAIVLLNIYLEKNYSTDMPEDTYLKEMCVIHLSPMTVALHLFISLPVSIFQSLPVQNPWPTVSASTAALFHVTNNPSALAASFTALMAATALMVSLAPQIHTWFHAAFTLFLPEFTSLCDLTQLKAGALYKLSG